MRIAVIGTSNSILTGGYVAALADHPAVDLLDNFSLGASTSVVLPKVAAERSLQDYDFVLLDFSVNEEYWVQQGSSTLNEIQQCLDDFVSKLGDKAIPAVVIMPTLTGIDTVLPVHAFYRQYAQSRGYPLFDGFEYIAPLRDPSAEIGALFLDRDHLRLDLARSLGDLIGRALADYRENTRVRRASRVQAAEYRYHKFTGAEAEGAALVSRSTSLTSADFVQLGPKDRIRLSFDETVELVGVGLNLAQSNSVLVINAGSEVRNVPAVGRHYRGDNKSLIYVVVPLKAIAGKDFELSVSTDYAEQPMLELAGVTLKTGIRDIEIPVFR